VRPVPNRRIAGFSLAFVAKVTLAAVIGILFLKFIVKKLPFPGLQTAVAAV
jgi:hypothetical protein